jgi:hypothetical protein
MGLHGTTTHRAHDTHDIWRGRIISCIIYNPPFEFHGHQCGTMHTLEKEGFLFLKIGKKKSNCDICWFD